MKRHHAMMISGQVSPGFESVREVFAENFSRHGDLGAACCVYHHGEKVVDLWGGLRSKSGQEPWQADTMVVTFSASKGLAAMTLALAHSRGWLDYDERVSTYWPEFAQHGKEAITVRQLLAHQAGLFAFDKPIDQTELSDFERLAEFLARQQPAWPAGTRQAYHAITLGFYESELLRRVDPQHRSLGEFFQDEIASPLGLDFYFRLPPSIPNGRLALLSRPNLLALLTGVPFRFILAILNRRSNIARALRSVKFKRDRQHIYPRNLEVPSAGGVGSARAMARAYSEFATGGHDLQLRAETLQALSAPVVLPSRGGYDACFMTGGFHFSLGFMQHCPLFAFGQPGSFGSPGAGGTIGFADPISAVGFAYVTNQMGTRLVGDPRELALREEVYRIIQR